MVYCAANWYCFCLTEQTQRGRERKRRWDAPATAGGDWSCWHVALCPGASSRRAQRHLHTRALGQLWGSAGDLLWMSWVEPWELITGTSKPCLFPSPALSQASVVLFMQMKGAPLCLCNAQMWHHLCNNHPAGMWLCPDQVWGCSWTACMLALREGKNIIFVFLTNKNILRQKIQLDLESVTWCDLAVGSDLQQHTLASCCFPKGCEIPQVKASTGWLLCLGHLQNRAGHVTRLT